jgi:Uma2 family endonuclease
MTDLLEMPEVRRRISPISVEEYHQFGEYNVNRRRTELIRGIVLEKPRKTPWYSSIAVHLVAIGMRLKLPGIIVYASSPLTFCDSEPEPDLSIIRGEASDFDQRHPSTAALAIEVVDGSAELERELASMYAEAGVEEYWIVLGHESAVEVYRLPVNGVYREKTVIEGNVFLTCQGVPEFTVSLDELFSREAS